MQPNSEPTPPPVLRLVGGAAPDTEAVKRFTNAVATHAVERVAREFGQKLDKQSQKMDEQADKQEQRMDKLEKSIKKPDGWLWWGTKWVTMTLATAALKSAVSQGIEIAKGTWSTDFISNALFDFQMAVLGRTHNVGKRVVQDTKDVLNDDMRIVVVAGMEDVQVVRRSQVPPAVWENMPRASYAEYLTGVKPRDVQKLSDDDAVTQRDIEASGAALTAMDGGAVVKVGDDFREVKELPEAVQLMHVIGGTLNELPNIFTEEVAGVAIDVAAQTYWRAAIGRGPQAALIALGVALNSPRLLGAGVVWNDAVQLLMNYGSLEELYTKVNPGYNLPWLSDALEGSGLKSDEVSRRVKAEQLLTWAQAAVRFADITARAALDGVHVTSRTVHRAMHGELPWESGDRGLSDVPMLDL